jgi:hypothetical protein
VDPDLDASVHHYTISSSSTPDAAAATFFMLDGAPGGMLTIREIYHKVNGFGR